MSLHEFAWFAWSAWVSGGLLVLHMQKNWLLCHWLYIQKHCRNRKLEVVLYPAWPIRTALVFSELDFIINTLGLAGQPTSRVGSRLTPLPYTHDAFTPV